MNSRRSSILFLGLMFLMLIPWQGICFPHLFHPDHHDYTDGPGICEMRKSDPGHEAMLWPPMECNSEAMVSDAFEKPSKEHLKISPETVFLAAIIYHSLSLPVTPEPVRSREINLHNLAPPGVLNPLRGPPFTCSLS